MRRRSPLVGLSVRAADFRVAYNAAVIAVKRGVKRSPQALGEVVLEAGDVLVLQAGEQRNLGPRILVCCELSISCSV